MDPHSVRTPRRRLLAPANFDFSILGEILRAERSVFVSIPGKERVARWGQVSMTHRLRPVSRREECGKDFWQHRADGVRICHRARLRRMGDLRRFFNPCATIFLDS